MEWHCGAFPQCGTVVHIAGLDHNSLLHCRSTKKCGVHNTENGLCGTTPFNEHSAGQPCRGREAANLCDATEAVGVAHGRSTATSAALGHYCHHHPQLARMVLRVAMAPASAKHRLPPRGRRRCVWVWGGSPGTSAGSRGPGPDCRRSSSVDVHRRYRRHRPRRDACGQQLSATWHPGTRSFRQLGQAAQFVSLVERQTQDDRRGYESVYSTHTHRAMYNKKRIKDGRQTAAHIHTLTPSSAAQCSWP